MARPRFFRYAYLCAIAIAMIGWSIVLGWASLALLEMFL